MQFSIDTDYMIIYLVPIQYFHFIYIIINNTYYYIGTIYVLLFFNSRKLNIIPTHLTRLLTGNIHPRLILSRLEMVEQLIVSQGVSSDKNRFALSILSF